MPRRTSAVLYYAFINNCPNSGVMEIAIYRYLGQIEKIHPVNKSVGLWNEAFKGKIGLLNSSGPPTLGLLHSPAAAESPRPVSVAVLEYMRMPNTIIQHS
jgi:hypothetical protein